MKFVATLIQVCLALSLAACGGGQLSVDLPGGRGEALELSFPPGRAEEHRLPFRISGGIPPYESSIEDCPDWVTLYPDQGILAGMAPAEDRGKTHFCTYRVTESDPGFRPARSVSYGLRLTVGSPTTSVLVLPSPGKVNLTVGTFRGEALPAAIGGVRPYTYAFTCAGGALPSGMGFAPATRRFAGIPDAPFHDSCTYSVTDSSQPVETVSVAVEVEVQAPPLELPSVSDVSLTVGTFRSVELGRARGGVPPYTYAFACAGGALPSGMGFAPATRRFAGTPDARFHDSCTYSVTDSSQPVETVSVAVDVEVQEAPALELLSVSNVSLTIGTFRSVELGRARGGVPPYTYAFTCAGGALPSGMGFAPATRRFAGTPDARFHDSCTYSATDSSQPAKTVSVAVEVEATGGETPLKLTRVFEGESLGEKLTLKIGRRSSTPFQEASGGVEPYAYELLDCTLPAGLLFHPNTRILSGTPNAEYRGPNCTYRVTDSSSPPTSFSLSFALIVEPLEASDWRFRTRTDAPGGPCALPGSGHEQVATLFAAHAGDGDARYAMPGVPRSPQPGVFLSFNPSNRVLTYTNPDPPPVLGTPDTYRYLVGTAPRVTAANADDALCLDVQYVPKDSSCGDEPPLTHVQIILQVRDDAFWDENAGNAGEYRCPDTTPPSPRPGAGGSPSNPVHEALGPVHARRALDFARGTVVDRVKGWSPGAPRVLSAITPAIGLATLSGSSEGFDYTGTSESLSAGAELGGGSWQAGLVASVTRTDLRYRAAAVLAEHGYRAGEHNTEIFSFHPFAAWHLPSGAHLWASLGAGMGRLSHRDDMGFPSWSRSDVRLRTYAAGAALPIADILSGELEAEAGIESFAFEIEGGDRISSTLPTMRGRDYRAGLAWNAPIAGAPFLSVAYKHLTGDGPEGGQLEAKGSVSVEGIFDPRLTVIGSAEGSFGLGDHEYDSWGLGGVVRFAPGEGGRGFAMNLDTRLGSPDEGASSDVGVRGEVGYGLWSGPYFGTVRPYVGLVRYSSDGSLRRALGIDLRDTHTSRVKVEFHDRALGLTLRHRF